MLALERAVKPIIYCKSFRDENAKDCSMRISPSSKPRPVATVNAIN